MIIKVGNSECKAVIGGKDNLKDLDKELRKYMRVRPKGYNHVRAYREYKWDGYKYFITPTGKFATGMLPLVVNFAKDLGCEVQLVDERDNLPEFGDWDFQMPEFELYDHQKRMVKSVDRYIGDLYFPRGIWDAATNSGKTAAFGSLVKSAKDGRALLLVHTQDLYRQHLEFYKTVFPEVGEIRGAMKFDGKQRKEVYDLKPFTIAMVKTLHNRIKKDMKCKSDMKNYFNILGVDECHRAAGKEYRTTIQSINAGCRILMSGTPLASDDSVNRMIIVGLGSNIIAKVTKEEMISKKLSMRPVVHYHWNKFDGVCFDYDDEVREVIHQSQYRADLINDIILSREEKKSLISFREIEHGRFMYENYVRKHGKYVHGGIVDWVHGEDEDRARKLQDYKDGKIRVLFASTIMQEGINVKDIDVLIYGQGGKSAVGVSQFSGRVERLSGTGEETVEFHDIYDDYKTVAKHSRKRANLLKKEGFEIIYHYEQRRGKPTGDKEETNVA